MHSFHHSSKRCLGGGDIRAVDAVSAISTGGDARRLVAVGVALELLANLVDVSGNRVGDGSTVAIVGVDTGKQVAAGGGDTVDGDVALVHVVAVTAGSVQLAEVLDGEVRDGDSTGTVVLDDLLLYQTISAWAC